tara:strand:- start:319 stop:687 length:369 start_codon:yes stop_codon:yes gene_type:complete
MKLELKDLAPYLPYGLDCYFTRNVKEENRIQKLISVLNIKENPCANLIHPLHQVKPILRPLSDYEKINEILDEMSDYQIQMIDENPDLLKRLSYDVMEKMFKNHIDVFGLIEKGLAINKNTI